MSADQKFTLTISGITLIFLVLTAILALIWRTGNKTGETLNEVKNLANDVKSTQEKLDLHIQWHLGKIR